MFYRRKILLAFFEAFGSHIDKIRLQKLLFLFCQEQEEPAFHFVPYKFGCYSFQANADLLALNKTGVVDDCDNEWHFKQPSSGSVALCKEDENLLKELQQRFSRMNKKQLIRHTYINFPFFAINSTILDQNLSESEIAVVHRSIVRDTTKTLFTIGYEGRTLEEFINILLEKNISLLCDVRKNAFSMKYGFSKNILSNACTNAHLTYLHFPDLGIESAQRKSLKTKEDYSNLFVRYCQTVLMDSISVQKKLGQKIQTAGRAALMCFEADPAMCHRSYCASALVANTQLNMPVVHL
jgi:uncharacterized protein (DUF488 family)